MSASAPSAPRRTFVQYAPASSPRPDAAHTTRAGGEAGSPRPRPKPDVTTLAVGEEGAGPR